MPSEYDALLESTPDQQKSEYDALLAQPSQPKSSVLGEIGTAIKNTAVGFVKGLARPPSLSEIALPIFGGQIERQYEHAKAAEQAIRSGQPAAPAIAQAYAPNVSELANPEATRGQKIQAGVNIAAEVAPFLVPALRGIGKYGVAGRSLSDIAFGAKPEPLRAETAAAEQIQKGGEISATQERVVKEGNIPKYPRDDTGRASTEAGGRGGNAPSPQAEAQAVQVAPAVPQPEQAQIRATPETPPTASATVTTGTGEAGGATVITPELEHLRKGINNWYDAGAKLNSFGKVNEDGSISIPVQRFGVANTDATRGGTWFELNRGGVSDYNAAPETGAAKLVGNVATKYGVGGKERVESEITTRNPFLIDATKLHEGQYPLQLAKKVLSAEEFKKAKRGITGANPEAAYSRLEKLVSQRLQEQGHDAVIFYHKYEYGSIPHQIFKLPTETKIGAPVSQPTETTPAVIPPADLVLKRTDKTTGWIPDLVKDHPLRNQLQQEAGIPVGEPITDANYEKFLAAAGRRGLTIETQDLRTKGGIEQPQTPAVTEPTTAAPVTETPVSEAQPATTAQPLTQTTEGGVSEEVQKAQDEGQGRQGILAPEAATVQPPAAPPETPEELGQALKEPARLAGPSNRVLQERAARGEIPEAPGSGKGVLKEDLVRMANERYTPERAQLVGQKAMRGEGLTLDESADIVLQDEKLTKIAADAERAMKANPNDPALVAAHDAAVKAQTYWINGPMKMLHSDFHGKGINLQGATNVDTGTLVGLQKLARDMGLGEIPAEKLPIFDEAANRVAAAEAAEKSSIVKSDAIAQKILKPKGLFNLNELRESLQESLKTMTCE